MKKYVFLTGKNEKFTKLQVNHSIWGTPIRYSEDTILATSQPNSDQPDSDLIVFNNLDEAVSIFAYTNNAPPVFEVELLESSVLTDDICSKSGDIYTNHKLTSPHNITKIISARHASITYDLSTAWEQREQLRIESNKLSDKYNSAADRTDLKTQIGNLLKLVGSLKGKLPYAELTDIIKATNEFLDHSSFKIDNAGKHIAFTDMQDFIPITKYRELAKSKQGAPSTAMQAVGLCMLALAAVVAAMGVGIVPGAALALVGVGLFAAGQRETGVCKAMNDLAMGRSLG